MGGCFSVFNLRVLVMNRWGSFAVLPEPVNNEVVETSGQISMKRRQLLVQQGFQRGTGYFSPSLYGMRLMSR